MKRFIVILLLGCIFLTGCLPYFSQTSISTITPVENTKTLTVSISPSPEDERSSTPPPRTQSSTITPVPVHKIPTVTSQPGNGPILVEIQESTWDALSLKGIVVSSQNLDGRLYDENGMFILVEDKKYLLHDLEINQTQEIIPRGDNIYDLKVSPGGKWIAYLAGSGDIERTDQSLVILSHDGQVQRVIPWEEEWGGLGVWLDDQHLVLRRESNSPVFVPYTPLLVLNPFSLETISLPPDPVDLYTLYPYPEWDGQWMIALDPGLTRRVYPNDGVELVLEDLEHQEILAAFMAFPFTSIPLWAPGGDQFVIANFANFDEVDDELSYDLFLVSRNGEMKRLTYLSEHYSDVYINKYQWSPLGEKIAFQFQIGDGNNIVLGIADIGSGETIEYSFPGIGEFDTSLVWSPDGQYLLMSGLKDDVKKILLFDPYQETAVFLYDETVPVGWLLADE